MAVLWRESIGAYMDQTEDLMSHFRELAAECTTAEAKLRELRDYARNNIPGVWHCPDDQEPCHECSRFGNSVKHCPTLGIRGYLVV